MLLDSLAYDNLSTISLSKIKEKYLKKGTLRVTTKNNILLGLPTDILFY